MRDSHPRIPTHSPLPQTHTCTHSPIHCTPGTTGLSVQPRYVALCVGRALNLQLIFLQVGTGRPRPQWEAGPWGGPLVRLESSLPPRHRRSDGARCQEGSTWLSIGAARSALHAL